MSIFHKKQAEELKRWLSIAGEIGGREIYSTESNIEDSYEKELRSASFQEDSGVNQKINLLYLQAGYTDQYLLKRKSLIIAMIIGSLLLIVISPYFFILTIIIIIFEYLRLSKKQNYRAQLFEQDYTALLLSLASAVRSGIDPLQALVDCQKLFDQQTPMHKELEIIQQALDRGFSEKKAISQFASTIKHPDLGLFRLAFLLARKEGSSLGQCLQRLARVTRHRQSFRRKIRSAVAMQKLSAYGIGASALVIGLMQYTSNPAGVAKTFDHPAGVPLLLTGVGCMLFGLGWMLYLARSKI